MFCSVKELVSVSRALSRSLVGLGLLVARVSSSGSSSIIFCSRSEPAKEPYTTVIFFEQIWDGQACRWGFLWSHYKVINLGAWPSIFDSLSVGRLSTESLCCAEFWSTGWVNVPWGREMQGNVLEIVPARIIHEGL